MFTRWYLQWWEWQIFPTAEFPCVLGKVVGIQDSDLAKLLIQKHSTYSGLSALHPAPKSVFTHVLYRTLVLLDPWEDLVTRHFPEISGRSVAYTLHES